MSEYLASYDEMQFLYLQAMRNICTVWLSLMMMPCAIAQSSSGMDFEKYEPVSTLVVAENKVTKAKFPFIDVHNHQWDMDAARLSALVTEMDKLNMAVMVNLSGGGGEKLKEFSASVKNNQPRRFIVFTNIDFDGFGKEKWTDRTLNQLEEDVMNGANGLKIYKNLGFSVTDQNGKRVQVDDPRLDPVWRKCGELQIPVLIHTADPKSFWDDMDARNERWLELTTHPRRKRSGIDPSFEQLISEQHGAFKKIPVQYLLLPISDGFPTTLQNWES